MKKYLMDYGFFVIILLFIIFPLLYITNFSFLAADDYCRATNTWNEIPAEFIKWYTMHNGRYANALFSLLPLYELQLNRLILAFGIIILGVVYYYFIAIFFSYFKFRISLAEKILLTSLIYATLIAQLPSLYEFFYWYAAVTVYLFSVIFFLLFLGLLFDLEKKRNVNLWLGSLIIILLNGNNEMFLGITNFLLLVLTAKYYFDQKRSAGRVSILFLVSLVSSLFVILAPGSHNRQSNFPEGGDFFGSVISSFLSAGIFSLKSLIEFPYLFFFIGLFFFILSLKKDKSIKMFYNPLVLGLISFIVIISTFFVNYYAVGYVKTYEGRIGNLIHIIFLIFLLINLVNLAVWLCDKKFRKLIFHPSLSRFFFLIYIISLLGFNSNFKNIWLDLIGGDLERFSLAMEERVGELQKVKTESLELIPIKGTRIMKFKDLKKDPADWRNECFRKMVNEHYGLNLRKIKRAQ